jgi:hypothetical protein
MRWTRRLTLSRRLALPRGFVGEIDLLARRILRRARRQRLRQRIGIEIIIDVHAIHVVAADDITDDGERALGGDGLAGVHPEHVAVFLHDVGVRQADVVGREGGFGLGVAGAVGVDPDVQLEAAPVRLLDPDGERVVARRATLDAGEVFRPGFEGGGVECVGGGADLEDDGIEAHGLRAIEERDDLGALLRGGQAAFARPVNVVDRRDPDAAELARGGRRLVGQRGRRCRRGRGRCRRGGGPAAGEEQRRSESEEVARDLRARGGAFTS